MKRRYCIEHNSFYDLTVLGDDSQCSVKTCGHIPDEEKCWEVKIMVDLEPILDEWGRRLARAFGLPYAGRKETTMPETMPETMTEQLDRMEKVRTMSKEEFVRILQLKAAGLLDTDETREALGLK